MSPAYEFYRSTHHKARLIISFAKTWMSSKIEGTSCFILLPEIIIKDSTEMKFSNFRHGTIIVGRLLLHHHQLGMI